MAPKNLLIAGLTASAVPFLAATLCLGYRFWFSNTGIVAAAIIVIAGFAGASRSLRRYEIERNAPGNELLPSLPEWVYSCRRIILLLLVLEFMHYYFWELKQVRDPNEAEINWFQ